MMMNSMKKITIMTQTLHRVAMNHHHIYEITKKQTPRKNESNHAPNSYSISIEVSEEYIDIVNKNNLQLFYLHRDENEDAVESFIYQMIQIEENILDICKKMSKDEHSKFKLSTFSMILKIMMGM